MLVQQILASKGSGQVITVTPETSVADVTLVLSKHRIGSVVVSANGKTAEGYFRNVTLCVRWRCMGRISSTILRQNT